MAPLHYRGVRIRLTRALVEERLAVWRNWAAEETRRFEQLYGAAYRERVLQWFARVKLRRGGSRLPESIDPHPARDMSRRMKVAYAFATDMAATFKLNTMILPQFEQSIHGARVVGMMCFDDNLYALRAGDPFGDRLSKVAKAQNILLRPCDQCAIGRGLGEGEFHQCGTGEVRPKGMIEGAQVGCFPRLYAALRRADGVQIITL